MQYGASINSIEKNITYSGCFRVCPLSRAVQRILAGMFTMQLRLPFVICKNGQISLQIADPSANQSLAGPGVGAM